MVYALVIIIMVVFVFLRDVPTKTGKSRLPASPGFHYLSRESTYREVRDPGFDKFFEKHPDSKKVYEYITSKIMRGDIGKQAETISDTLIDLGAKAIILNSCVSNDIVVFTKEMAFVSDFSKIGDHGIIEIFEAPYKERFMARVGKNERQNVSSYTRTIEPKQKSVVGSAIAGGVIAGGAGAIVGAVAAASHNSNAKPTQKTEFYSQGTGMYDYYYKFKKSYNHRMFLNNDLNLDEYHIYFSKEIRYEQRQNIGQQLPHVIDQICGVE